MQKLYGIKKYIIKLTLMVNIYISLTTAETSCHFVIPDTQRVNFARPVVLALIKAPSVCKSLI